METQKGTRLRVNISTTSKGWYSWDHTAEVWSDEATELELEEQVHRLSEGLEEVLSARYGHLQDKPKEA